MSASFKEIVSRNLKKVTDSVFFDDVTEGSEPLDPGSRYRVFEFLIYEDSCEPDWIDFLSSLHIQIYAIRHDHDLFMRDDPDRGIKAGDSKKVHWHVWLNFPGKKSGVTIIEICARCGGVRLQEKKSAIGSCRYLTHMDESDKYHYSPNDVLKIGGSQDYTEYCMSGSDSLNDIVREMESYIYENNITNFARFALWCSSNNKMWHDVLTSKRTLYFITYIKSIAYALDQEIEDAKKK